MDSWSTPECLLTPHKRSFILNEEVAKKIEEINKPLAVVCITGPLRQGKSSLMNRLVMFLVNNQLQCSNNGFFVNSTRVATTKGFWVWYINHPNNNDQGMLIIDVEGLGDTSNKAYDNCLLCLSILLSSTFIYNVSSETIDRELIDKLHFVKISEHIQHQINESDDDLHDDPFPLLIVVLRNVSLDSEDESNDYYFDRRLRTLSVNTSENSSTSSRNECDEIEMDIMSEQRMDGEDCKEKIKKLTDYFMRRKLFMFPIPVSGNEKSNQTHNLPDERLKKEFVVEVDSFCKYVSENAPLKTIHNKPITGKICMDLLRKYLEHLDANGCVSRFGFDAKGIIERENNLVLEKSIGLYQEKMKNLLKDPVGIERLNSVHEEAHEAMLKYFMANVYLDGRSELHEKLKKLIDENYISFIKANMELSSEICHKKLQDLSALTFKRLQSREVYVTKGGYEKLSLEVEEIKLRYQAIPDKGVMADKEWDDFMTNKMEQHLKYIMDIDEFLTKSEKTNKGARLKDQRESRQINLRNQSQNLNKSCQDMITKGGSSQFDRVEDAYKRRIGETAKYYEKRIGELRNEQNSLRDEGRYAEANIIDEEIEDIQRKQNSSVGKMREFITTMKEWLHILRPVIEFGCMLFSLYHGRPPPGRPFMV